MDKRLLEKYLNNRCNGEELNIVLSWFRDSACTSEGKNLLHTVWTELPGEITGKTADSESILNRIHHDINLHQAKQMIEEADYDLSKYGRRQYLLRLFRNAAAILLIPLLGTVLFFSIRYYSLRSLQISEGLAYNEIISSVDAITKLTLPDGSTVWLNHRSSLRYPAIFTGKYRKVELKGEGYFDVKHNSKFPFIVSTGGIEILARGTSFNVMAYPEEEKIETSLINGSAELRKASPDGRLIYLYKMKPTDYTVYNKRSNLLLTRTITDERYFSWKDGKLIFTSEPYEEVIKKLSRWFNVDIILKDNGLRDFPLTATFVNESLPQVMELLTLVSPVRYRIKNAEKKNDGTFTRKKVFIYHR